MADCDHAGKAIRYSCIPCNPVAVGVTSTTKPNLRTPKVHLLGHILDKVAGEGMNPKHMELQRLNIWKQNSTLLL